MITRIVKLQFHESKIDDFLILFNETKLKVSNFEGCLGMRLLNDLQNPKVFYTYSNWTSEEALLNYRGSDVFKTLWKSIKPLFEIPAEASSTLVYFEGFPSNKK